MGMQEIRETSIDRESGVSRELRDKMVGLESQILAKSFAARRTAAEQRLEKGEIEKLEVRESRRIAMNDPCPCGSREVFQACCGRRLPADDSRMATTPPTDDGGRE